MKRRAWMTIKDFYGKGSDARVEITSFIWGTAKGGDNGGAVGGLDTGKAAMSEFTIAKATDEISPKLWERASSGQKFDKVIILIENQVGNDYKPYLNYEFTDVYITAMSVQGSRGKDGSAPTEYTTFNFGKADLKVIAAVEDPNATARQDTPMWTP